MTQTSLNDRAARQDADHGGTLKMTARDVDVFYGAKQAIKNVSIDVTQENVTAFIGPSGCGKSSWI